VMSPRKRHRLHYRRGPEEVQRLFPFSSRRELNYCIAPFYALPGSSSRFFYGLGF